MPVTVTNQNFSRIIFSGPNPVLLYFSSPENEISRRQDTIPFFGFLPTNIRRLS